MRRVVRIHICRWCLYTIHPLGRTLCTNRLGWSQGNWLLCRRTYSPLGMKCSQYPCVPRPPRYNPTGMKLMGCLLPALAEQRLLHLLHPGPSQIPDNIMHIKSVFFSLRAPVSQTDNETAQTERPQGPGRWSHSWPRKAGRKHRPTSTRSTPSAKRLDLSYDTSNIYYRHLLMIYPVLSLWRIDMRLLYYCIFLYRLSVCLPRLLYTYLPNRYDIGIV